VQICSFFRLAGYYRRFILNFSKIAKPKTKLLEKEAKLKWSPQCEEVFLTLKKLLSTAPVLVQPDIENPTSRFRMDLELKFREVSRLAFDIVSSRNFEFGQNLGQG
jgi:hypothetical protein